MGRVPVEPAHVALIDGFDIVRDRAIVAPGIPGVIESRWKQHLVRNLGTV